MLQDRGDQCLYTTARPTYHHCSPCSRSRPKPSFHVRQRRCHEQSAGHGANGVTAITNKRTTGLIFRREPQTGWLVWDHVSGACVLASTDLQPHSREYESHWSQRGVRGEICVLWKFNCLGLFVYDGRVLAILGSKQACQP